MNSAGTTPELVALRRARERADVANHFLSEAIHAAVWAARDDGMNTGQIAAMLQLPRRDVRRHLHKVRSCAELHALPMWGTPDEYTATHVAIYGTKPLYVPFQWGISGQSRTLRIVPAGTITIKEN